MLGKKFKFILSAVCVLCNAIASASDAPNEMYAAITKQDGNWKVISITEIPPDYKEGMEILLVPSFQPQYDTRIRISQSTYGGFDCPLSADSTTYTICSSYFSSFVGANWFGLGGKRVNLSQTKLSEVKNFLMANETVANIIAKNNEAYKNKKLKDQESLRAAQAQIEEFDRLRKEKREAAEKNSKQLDW